MNSGEHMVFKKIITVSLLSMVLLISGCGPKSRDIEDPNKRAKVRAYKQEWLVLDVDHYKNGDLIPQVQDKKQWASLKTGAWCYYNNDQNNKKKYGKLYNWYAVHDSRGLAPDGWHIPTVNELKILELFVGNDGNALKMKGEGKGVNKGTNTTGFSAWLAGYRNHLGDFANIGNYAAFWTSEEYNATNANSVFLNNVNNGIAFSNNNKEYGFSVRCVKN
jgi:uncharacterized protein (TIGR02145 family)